MIKIAMLVVVIAAVVLAWQVSTKGWPGLPSSKSSGAAVARSDSVKGALPTPTPLPGTPPPREIEILAANTFDGSVRVLTKERGWVGEGDFYKDWRVVKLLEKGAVFRDDSGSEYIVRFYVLPVGEPEPPNHMLAIPLKQVVASQVVDAVKPLMGDVVCVANAANSGVILSGKDFQHLAVMAELVRSFDRRADCIVINAVVGRLIRGKGVKVGLYDLLKASAVQSADAPFAELLAGASIDLATGISTFGASIAAREVLAAVTDFNSKGYTFDVVSRPSLTVLSGQQGELATGREIPIPYTTTDIAGSQTSIQYKQAEFSFNVVATVRPDGSVRIVLEQKNADVVSTAEIGGNTVPTLATQKLKTQIDLNSSQLAYLGGIHVRSFHKESRGVPVLKDIPVVNWVFGTKDHGHEDSELVVLLSAEVIPQGEVPVRVRRAEPVGALKTLAGELDYSAPYRGGGSEATAPR